MKRFYSVALLICLFSQVVNAQTPDFSATRNKNWQDDLATFRERFPAYDKTLTPLMFLNTYDQKLYWYSQANLLDSLYSGVEQLSRDIPTISDEAVMMRLARLTALSPNAHTRFYLLRVRTVLNNIPVGTWWFGKELRIVSAEKKFASILGARILRINGITPDSLFNKLQPYISGTEAWHRYMSLYFLRSPQAMAGIGSGNKNELELTVETPAGKQLQIRLPARFVPQTSTLEAWKDLSPVSTPADSLAHLLAQKELPLYLRHTNRSYTAVLPEKDGIAYVQINRNENDKEQSFADYLAAFAEKLGTQSFHSFVLDLRFNTGGDYNTTVPALQKLALQLKGKKVFIISGPALFSAGIVTAAAFKKASGATVLGEGPGDGLVFLSEGGNVTLPHSRLNVHYANGLHNWMYTPEFSVEPEVPIKANFSDYQKGIDPVMEYIRKQHH